MQKSQKRRKVRSQLRRKLHTWWSRTRRRRKRKNNTSGETIAPISPVRRENSEVQFAASSATSIPVRPLSLIRSAIPMFNKARQVASPNKSVLLSSLQRSLSKRSINANPSMRYQSTCQDYWSSTPLATKVSATWDQEDLVFVILPFLWSIFSMAWRIRR